MKPYPDVPAGLVVEHSGGVLDLRIDRPDRRNSLTDPIVYAMIATFEAAASDEDVRVIHLSGTGDHFCSGFDLGERVSGPDRPRVGSIHRRMNGHVNRLIPVMLSTQTPIVCTARGWVIGLGLDLLLASDFAIVADDARLWAPFTTFGFTPDSGASWLIPRLAGVARAKDMLMLGTKVPGREAADWGLVHRAVPADELDAAGAQLVAQLAAAPTVAVGLTKLLINNGLTADLDRHLVDEAFAMEVSSRSDDFKEYGRAAREKRPPDFTGR
ncbi:MAG: enoyl-CoA hydratase/isomerase family protein [Ilumatobacteraceae bacterium]|nr:enoyl-CoA hydratase/isomerase family protein [Ilumatobacteraceae bacterium]